MLALQMMEYKPETTFSERRLTVVTHSIPREVMQGRDVTPYMPKDTGSSW